MSDWRTDPRREADRLRIILESFAAVSPDMPMSTAVPLIFETEEKTAKLESQAVEAVVKNILILPDFDPKTIAKFIDLCPDIQDFITGKGRSGPAKIHAIKEVRARTYAGLKEAKGGVDEWAAQNSLTAPVVPSWAVSTAHLSDIARWMDEPAQSDILAHLPHKRIIAIKEVRFRYPTGIGLKEAKDAVEYWLDGKHHV